MADTFSKEKRSQIMRSIKGMNTMPELLVRQFLFKKGFRFSLHRKNLPGTPDIVLRKYKTIIFVNGCFWHGHLDCSKSSLPKTRIQFWHDKIARNREKDIINEKKLIDLGWNVITVFQCELKNKNIEDTMSNVILSIENNLSPA
jgi:DNA mismatch endonuclease (patch repair protein)